MAHEVELLKLHAYLLVIIFVIFSRKHPRTINPTFIAHIVFHKKHLHIGTINLFIIIFFSQKRLLILNTINSIITSRVFLQSYILVLYLH
jgi:hypothetical protein